MKLIWGTRYQHDDMPDSVCDFFYSYEEARKYAAYREYREQFEHHKESFFSPGGYSADDDYLFDSAEEAIEQYEDVHGPMISGEERLKEIHERAIADGTRKEFIMVSKPEWDAFSAWKNTHQPTP